MNVQTQTGEFDGGLKLRPVQSTNVARIKKIEPRENDKLYISLDEHIGNPSIPVVRAGQHVKKYELLARPQGHVSVAQHAPASGVIESVSIDNATEVGEGDASRFEIVLVCDGLEQTIPLATPINLSSERLCDDVAGCPDSLKQKLYERIAAAGIVGMGGAGFPAHVKLKEGMNADVTECIINGVECEPLASSDSAVINLETKDLISSAVLIGRLLNASRVILAVNFSINFERLRATAELADVEVVVAPARYPAGSEKQLIKVVTGKELPLNNLPIHVGVVCFNVATAMAMLEAATVGKPSVARVLTINSVEKTVAEVPIGLPICQVIERLDDASPEPARVTTGGMMMSRPLTHEKAPVKKTTNEISSNVSSELAVKHARTCVRCGECVSVCPIKLQPQQLFQLSQQSDLDELQDYGLFDCIECGCCDYVCPSGIPLVENFRGSKQEINSLVEAGVQRAWLLQRYQSHLSRQNNETPAERNAALADMNELTLETIDDELAKLKARLNSSVNDRG